MLLGMVDDPRVVLIKLADRLHNMRTMYSLNIFAFTLTLCSTKLDIYRNKYTFISNRFKFSISTFSSAYWKLNLYVELLYVFYCRYALPLSKAQAVAQETLAIWCSLASRLGLWALKAELEDLCFAVLQVRPN